jgi:AraC-like DNA-binding protein
MEQEFLHRRPQRDLVVRNLLNAFIIAAARLGSGKTNIVHMDSTQNKIVKQFHALTDEHFLKRTQVAQYADMLYISPGHLNDVIKMATGRTAKQVIDEKRIMEAKRLLFWGNHSVKEIAGRLNFEDDAYFNRFFKKHTGQSPALFLKYSREKYNEYLD